MQIKKAVVLIGCVLIQCPHCHASKLTPVRTSVWDIEMLTDKNRPTVCRGCGKKFKLPTQLEAFNATGPMLVYRPNAKRKTA